MEVLVLLFGNVSKQPQTCSFLGLPCLYLSRKSRDLEKNFEISKVKASESRREYKGPSDAHTTQLQVFVLGGPGCLGGIDISFLRT